MADRVRRVQDPTAAAASTAISVDMPEDTRIYCTDFILDMVLTGASLDGSAVVTDGGALNVVGGQGNANYAQEGITYQASGARPIIPKIHPRFLRYLAEYLSKPGLVQGPGRFEDKSHFAAATPQVVAYNNALSGTGLNVAMRLAWHIPFYHALRGALPLTRFDESSPILPGQQALDVGRAPGFQSLLDAQAVSSLDLSTRFGSQLTTRDTTPGDVVNASAAGTLTASGRGFSTVIREVPDMPPGKYLFTRLISEVRTNPAASGQFRFDLDQAKGAWLLGVLLVVLDNGILSDDFLGDLKLTIGGTAVVETDFMEAQHIGVEAAGLNPLFQRPGIAWLDFNAEGYGKAMRGAYDLTGANAGKVQLLCNTNASGGGTPLVAMISVLWDPIPPGVVSA